MIVNFEGFNKKQKEFKNYKDSILKLIDEFILYNIAFTKIHLIKDYVESHDFSLTILGTLKVSYFTQRHSGEVFFTKEEFEELKKFMENPELYRNVNKYNL